jgi:hypothetical protein
MALSNSTVKNLSIALTPEVINAIYSDERWMDFMMEMVPEIVIEKLGTEDYDLVAELACAIQENIILKSVTVQMSKGVSVK